MYRVLPELRGEDGEMSLLIGIIIGVVATVVIAWVCIMIILFSWGGPG